MVSGENQIEESEEAYYLEQVTLDDDDDDDFEYAEVEVEEELGEEDAEDDEDLAHTLQVCWGCKFAPMATVRVRKNAPERARVRPSV